MSARLLLLLLLFAPACHRAAQPNATVVHAIQDVGSPTRLRALNQAALAGGDVQTLAPLLADADERVRWGAAYVGALWADDAREAAALAPLLDAEQPGIRAMVAGSLAGLGQPRARETLAALVASVAPMPFSDPPITVGTFARDALAALDAARAKQ
jgi:HEAT repeat protein